MRRTAVLFLAALAVAVTPIVALHAQLAIAEPLILPLILVSQFALFAVYSSQAPPGWLAKTNSVVYELQGSDARDQNDTANEQHLRVGQQR